MRIAVLGSPTSWYWRDLERAVAGRHELVCVSFRDLSAAVGGSAGGGCGPIGAGGLDLRTCDAVLVRTMPQGSLEQVVFRMDLLARLESAGVLVINPAKAIEAAVDKFLTTARLAAAGLRVPATRVCQTVEEGLAAFAELGGDVVLKPLFGGEGRGIARLTDEALAQRTFSLLVPLGGVLYLQQFVPHAGYDQRVLLVGQRAWAIRRRNALDWRTNLSRGAEAETCPLDDATLSMAREAAAVVGAPLAGVDLLPGLDGVLYAIEVNAVPGWQGLARATGVDIAAAVIDEIATRSRTPEDR